MRPTLPVARPHLPLRLLSLLILAGLGGPALGSGADAHAPAKSEPAAKAPARPAAKLAPDDPPPAATADPMEQLRQRLAGRLSGRVESPQPNEVRLVSQTTAPPAPPPAAARAAAAHARPAAAAAAGIAAPSRVAAAHGGPGAPAHWSYNGPAGPATWGGLKPEFSLCGNGQRQSPIDIRGGLAVDLDPVKFDYQTARFAVVDNGHTVQANIAPGSSIEIGGKRFDLVQFHFHRPSEERIDGRQFEMSLHLVHRDDQGRLAVVAVLLDKGPAQPAVQRVWNNLPLEKGEELAARAPLELADLLPADRRYFTYMGSLTTPPCSEGVQWVVMRQPVTMSPEQIEIFARIYPMNARPIQQVSGRRILQSQ